MVTIQFENASDEREHGMFQGRIFDPRTNNFVIPSKPKGGVPSVLGERVNGTTAFVGTDLTFGVNKNGTHVHVIGMVNEPALNHMVGTVIGYDLVACRYIVLLSNLVQICVNLENIQQHIFATIYNLPSCPFNGSMVTVIGFDQNALCCSVVLSDNTTTINIKPENVIFPPGTVVKLTSLILSPELNGVYGTITGTTFTGNGTSQPSLDRYHVQLANKRTVMVKPSSVRL
ncbi:hypothetical protein MPSEU_001095400 [Mayamaea pseudoterrestris]|nr:hypothetical protein MPSEU_001095400 [Mayamaea pseudoterrestris]